MRLSAINRFFKHAFSPKAQATIVCIGSNSVVIHGLCARLINCVAIYYLYKQERYRLWW